MTQNKIYLHVPAISWIERWACPARAKRCEGVTVGPRGVKGEEEN